MKQNRTSWRAALLLCALLAFMMLGTSALASATPELYSVSFGSNTAVVNQNVAITASTSYIGSSAVSSWTSGYTDKGTTRTWNVNYTFAGTGNRTFNFKATGADGKATAALSASIKILPELTLKSVKFDKARVTRKRDVTITAVTSTSAAKLIMYSGTSVVCTWTKGYTDKGTTRTWKVGYTFSGTGDRIFVFKAKGYDGSLTEKKEASIVIMPELTLDIVKFDSKKVNVSKPAVIKAVTSTAATKLNMYSGSSLIKSWTEGYKDSGNVRTWTVYYAFSGKGNRSFSFRAVGFDNALSELKTAEVTIIDAPVITCFYNGQKINMGDTINLNAGQTITVKVTVANLCQGNQYKIDYFAQFKDAASVSIGNIQKSDSSISYDLNIGGKAAGNTPIYTVVFKPNQEGQASDDDVIVDTFFKVNLPISSQQKAQTQKVKRIYNADWEYYKNGIEFRITFYDASNNPIPATAAIDMVFINDYGETVYNTTRYVTEKDFGTYIDSISGFEHKGTKIYIPYSDIIPGACKNATAYVTFRSDFFNQKSQEWVYHLPTLPISITQATDLPISNDEVKITQCVLEKDPVNYMNLEIKLTCEFLAEMPYDIVRYKIIDENGNTFQSGRIELDPGRSLCFHSGEKKEVSVEATCLLFGHQYTISFSLD